MYTLLINDDKYIHTTKRERIFQNTMLHNNVRILARNDLFGFDMAECKVTMLYELPITHECGIVFLEPSEELYRDSHMEYIIPSNTLITTEHGDVVIELIISANIDGEEKLVERIVDGKIHIEPYDRDWDDIIGDEEMEEIQSTIIDIQAIRREQEALLEEIREINLIDDLIISEDGKLYLAKKGEAYGSGANVVIPDIDDGEIDGNSNGIIEVDKLI